MALTRALRTKLAPVLAGTLAACASASSQSRAAAVPTNGCSIESYLAHYASPVPAAQLVPDSLLDSELRHLSSPNPEYPAALRNEGIRGTVVVGFVVAPGGRVVSAEAMNSAHPELIAAALRMVRASTFTTPTRGGQGVYTFACVPVAFSVV
jgi:TonB family protein